MVRWSKWNQPLWPTEWPPIGQACFRCFPLLEEAALTESNPMKQVFPRKDRLRYQKWIRACSSEKGCWTDKPHTPITIIFQYRKKIYKKIALEKK